MQLLNPAYYSKTHSAKIKVPNWYAVQVSDTTMYHKEQMFVTQKSTTFP